MMVDTIGNSRYICGRAFKSDKSFSVHILESHGNENHKCDQCDKEFESKEQLEIHMMVTHPEGQDSLDDEDREGTEPLKLRFMKGYDHTDPRNPGVLIVNEAYRFAFNKSRGDQLHYHCLKKGSTKCKAKCTVVSQLESVNGTDVFKYEVDQKKDIDDHNHDTNEADVIIAEMLQEMHSKFRKNLTVKPSVVRKQVMQKYRAKTRVLTTGEKLLIPCLTILLLTGVFQDLERKSGGKCPRIEMILNIRRFLKQWKEDML